MCIRKVLDDAFITAAFIKHPKQSFSRKLRLLAVDAQVEKGFPERFSHSFGMFNLTLVVAKDERTTEDSSGVAQFPERGCQLKKVTRLGTRFEGVFERIRMAEEELKRNTQGRHEPFQARSLNPVWFRHKRTLGGVKRQSGVAALTTVSQHVGDYHASLANLDELCVPSRFKDGVLAHNACVA